MRVLVLTLVLGSKHAAAMGYMRNTILYLYAKQRGKESATVYNKSLFIITGVSIEKLHDGAAA